MNWASDTSLPYIARGRRSGTREGALPPGRPSSLALPGLPLGLVFWKAVLSGVPAVGSSLMQHPLCRPLDNI